MNKFEKKNLLQLRKLSLDELKRYYSELRIYNYENNVPLKNIEIRKKIHKLLVSIIKIDRMIAKEKLTVISDKRSKTDKPVIYACTHIGGNDIQRTFEAIKDHAYLFLGDPEGLYKDISGLLLYLNGVLCLETDNKKDRFVAMKRSIELLNKNGDLLIYPEGAWNVTDNLPVMKLYTGTVKMALETGADIVPVAIEQYDNRFYVNIGENISVKGDENINDLNNTLRNSLATLKWEIWEKQGVFIRKCISENYSEKFKQDIIDKCEYGFTIDDVYKTMYKDENDLIYEEVKAVIKKYSHKIKV